MRLAFLEKQLDDVELQVQRPGQRDLVGPWRTRGSSANAQCGSVAHGHCLRDGCFAIEHGDRFAPLTARRYSLSRAFSSAILTCFMVTLGLEVVTMRKRTGFSEVRTASTARRPLSTLRFFSLTTGCARF